MSHTIARRTIVTFTIAIMLLLALRPIACTTELVDRVDIPNSNWIVEAFSVGRTSVVSGGVTKIVATDKKTNDEIVVSRMGELVDCSLSIDSRGQLVVTLPNMVDITEARDSFGPVKVVYKFVPWDDPEERANYQLWMHHPDDPRAVEWYRKTIERK